MWSGSLDSIPLGWQLCDGTNGTPDLRDRFIVGAGKSYSFKDTGGNKSHSHSYSGYTKGVGSVRGQLRTRYHDIKEGNNGFEHQYSGTTSEENSLPPYFSLVFIMKL